MKMLKECFKHGAIIDIKIKSKLKNKIKNL
jgi:hypothetical protein